MKKLFIVSAVLVIILCLPNFVIAANDDVMKISMNSEVKKAKELDSGNGIEFTLPDISSTEFIIQIIELAIFEKKQDESSWSIYKDQNGNESKKRLIENPSSLKIQADFGDVSDYRIGSKYKLAYRYYVQSLSDMSIITIAGADIKDGWRMVGEQESVKASNEGFMFYLNTPPTININSISYDAENISGTVRLNYSAEELTNVYLHKDALANGITIDYEATDNDSEDNLIVSYQMVDGISKEVIAEVILDSDNIICCSTQCDFAELKLIVSDNWGKSTEGEKLLLKIDNENPYVYSEFSDMSRVLRGRNLYSKFTILDAQNIALTNGMVYYTVTKNGVELYKNVQLSNNASSEYTVDLSGMADGQYVITLTIFDKAYNKIIHTLSQTLDNTAPNETFLTPTDNANATLYSTWMNESKKIMIKATDEYAGVKKCNYYLDYSFQGTTNLNSPLSYAFSYNVSTTKTGKLYYYFYVYDNACTINKAANTVNTNSSGNSRYVGRYVWLDKTVPTVNINTDENTWYNAPITVTMTANDYESVSGKGDASGVKSKEYCITDTSTLGDNWLLYPTNGVTFNSGGVYYLHIKVADYAGNETVRTKKIKVNTKSVITDLVTPTNDYLYTIYNKTTNNNSNVYVIKNTAYNTKYKYRVQDADAGDIIRTDIRLVNCDDSSTYATVSVDTQPTGDILRTVVFNMPYTKVDGTPLSDGVYKMLLTVSEMKNETDILTMYQNVVGCEVIIKRSPPPPPQIDVSAGTVGKDVTITYPNESVAGSLNNAYVKAMYKKEYKLVFDGDKVLGEYLPYTSKLSDITKDCVVTAIYTDVAGNISTATKRIYADSDEKMSESILTDGNTVTVEEGRPANVYYIGTRKDKKNGIKKSIFNFLK